MAGIFTEEIVSEMATHVERPIIFPLSNPTHHAEATPSDLLKWTSGRVIIGTGSPFEDIYKLGKPFRVDQINNSYIFPGVGLGLIAVKAKHVTDNMFMAAALALAECSPAKKDPNANLLPPLTQIREVSLQIALAVAEEVIRENLACFIPKKISLVEHIKSLMWVPEYLPYKKKVAIGNSLDRAKNRRYSSIAAQLTLLVNEQRSTEYRRFLAEIVELPNGQSGYLLTA